MTEHQIEREAERRMDRLDASYLKGEITSEAYDKAIRELDEWAREQQAKGRAR